MTSTTISIPPAGAPARVIRDDADAIATAHHVAELFRADASLRDQQRRLPHDELNVFSQSGLWAITVPAEYGGAAVSYVTLTEVIRIVAAADPSLGQLPQNHLGIVDVIGLAGTPEQKRRFFAEVLAGKRFGNGFSERGTRNVLDLKTRITANGSGLRVNGTKFYSTGALFADWIPILALDDEQRGVLAFIERGTPGLKVVDDWSGFGQRTTASGTVIADNVEVSADAVLASYEAYDKPTRNGPLSQIIQAAIDAGIARAALDDTIRFVRERSRAWVDSGVERAADDPLTIREIGDLAIRIQAAEALLEKAAQAIDALPAEPTSADVARASVAVAQAKVLTTEAALRAGEKLFELAGTQSVLAEHNYDRHWRNARTHTLHDPVRWKYHLVGNYVLNGVEPPRHAWN
ncbi:SfnB family sulfur acquisition oxidoreductase [Pararobbsia silviterrae]|uniref:Dibenzothiophene monooxygenase n=1 Tax=Pararobbsia silviterrae TaxID=1792498 RepID=A0A494Y2T0_9BURK|nr:SfnB family sulfur acquisition oxidoreductase [Pararobbsia silviterrae]RKP55763.1 SfnB family sulfur acquisition oxidoreductase [Pararobbsia silviterrae]